MAKKIIWIFVFAICIASLTCTKIDQDMMLAGEEPGKLQIPPLEVWQRTPDIDYNIPYYAKYLEGLKICLDPGHGGHANLKNYKRGPTGLREAVVNLRVAKFLREFLNAAGADVVLTREGDYDTDPNAGKALRRRAEIASENNCDFFISLHHNASGRQSANFTSVWYHDNPDYLYANMDLARYVTNSLEEFLRLPEPQHNGLYSDYLIYPDAGFGVLRHLRVPGILIESSFHSNYEEEDRLRDPEYNRREAWAIFIGIARYARNGIPHAELLVPSQ
jgi:N-acetylmuramoyl-L-alanine amidase